MNTIEQKCQKHMSISHIHTHNETKNTLSCLHTIYWSIKFVTSKNNECKIENSSFQNWFGCYSFIDEIKILLLCLCITEFVGTSNRIFVQLDMYRLSMGQSMPKWMNRISVLFKLIWCGCVCFRFEWMERDGVHGIFHIYIQIV